jgi:serine/threonine protein kinase
MRAILEGIDSKYVIINEIGNGGTCSVFKGYSLEDKSKKLYAIKIFKEKAKEYFDKEILINKYLPSEYFLSIYKYGSGHIRQEFDNFENMISLDSIDSIVKYKGVIYYIIEELSENGELFNYVYKTGEGFPENLSIKIFKKLAKCVKILHDNRIAHCDIKPENVLIGNDFSIKLIDFGFSQVLEKDDNFIYEYRGSDIYASPEVNNRNMKGYDALKNDIFSLGVLLFVITVRCFPFERPGYLDRKYRLIMNKKYDDFWRYYQQFNLSDEFKDFVNHLLCYDPSERLTIDEILEHPIMKEITNKNYELNNINENITMSIEDFDEELVNELENRKIIIDAKVI